MCVEVVVVRFLVIGFFVLILLRIGMYRELLMRLVRMTFVAVTFIIFGCFKSVVIGIVSVMVIDCGMSVVVSVDDNLRYLFVIVVVNMVNMDVEMRYLKILMAC